LADHTARKGGELRPIRAELEFQRDAGDDAEREIEGKNLGPKLRHFVIMVIAGDERACSEVEEQQGQPHGQLGKEVVEGDGESKLEAVVKQRGFHCSFPVEKAPCYACDSTTPGRAR
jgi:hypothetical protein